MLFGLYYEVHRIEESMWGQKKAGLIVWSYKLRHALVLEQNNQRNSLSCLIQEQKVINAEHSKECKPEAGSIQAAKPVHLL